ncbi:MAG: agmatine deiminase family protein, partial [Calditrichaeota bacterium]|nr:agmatine deiminase family protein [Calditrichota bacterium]
MSTQKNRWIYFSLLAISLLLYACDDSNDNKKEVDDYWMPGEYETHQAVMLASPTVDYKVGWSMLDVQADMIKEILVNGNVDYAVIDEQDSIKLDDKLIARGVSQNMIDSKINFLIADHADLWVRDYGGIYMRNKKGDLAAVDFDFDGYRLAQYGDQTLKN